MVITTLDEIDSQSIGSEGVLKAISFLRDHRDGGIELGRFEVDGDTIYGASLNYDTKGKDVEVVYEAHRQYIDVQYMISGEEVMKWMPLSDLKETQAYDEEGDCLLGVDGGAAYGDIPFVAGQVMVLYPTDAHAPGFAAATGSQNVQKLVVKVPVH